MTTRSSSHRQPTPIRVAFTPSSASLPANSSANAPIAVITVTMSDGSSFVGSLTASPSSVVKTSGSSLVLSRALVPADVGSYQWSVTASTNAGQASGTIQVTVTAVAPPPPPPSHPVNSQGELGRRLVPLAPRRRWLR
jgi:hypothetical protein